ncbi:hypothetical protein SLA_6069 [Streptomyces laurentii]|uniref:Uncharacterized protein n=1 Tax=Streptomyces laurentii TaxID=39478 RepID=A0A169P9F5_STRLU|nr:hypothetical protein SLA_6069 [Streptomyces laurentii]
MSWKCRPVYRGLPVPAVATWEGEWEVTPAVYLRGGRISYADPLFDASQRHRGALWRVWSLARDKGVPELGGVHPARQRLAMRRLLCQVCFLQTGTEAAREGGTLFVVGASSRAGTAGPIEDGERTPHPPVHLECAWESARSCPHLLEGMAAARVPTVRPWGVLGVLHASIGDHLVPVDPRVQVAYEDPYITRVLARQAVVELDGCRPVDLRAEAERAGLAGVGAR